jgi:ribosomal protein S27AE
MIETIILTGSCPRCGTGTLTSDEDMFGVRIFCVMCGHNRDLGKLPMKVRNIKDLVIAVLEYDKQQLAKQRAATYPPSVYG